MPQRAPCMRWYGLERWRQRAKAQLRSEPLCALCLAMGRPTSDRPDHVSAPRRRQQLLDWSASMSELECQKTPGNYLFGKFPERTTHDRKSCLPRSRLTAKVPHKTPNQMSLARCCLIYGPAQMRYLAKTMTPRRPLLRAWRVAHPQAAPGGLRPADAATCRRRSPNAQRRDDA